MSLSPSLLVQPNDIRAASVVLYDGQGNLLSGFDSSRPATATITTLAATNASQTLLAANPARRQIYIVNEATKTLFVAFGATASATVYTFAIAGGQIAITMLNGYTGVLSALLSSGTGNVRVTEVTT